jgi:hypothetical protein
MFGCFTDHISGVEFGERGVHVVEVEQNAGHAPIFCIDFDDGKHLETERIVPLIA